MFWSNRIARYFNYLANAKTRYGIHSPFVYEFIEQVLRPAPPALVKKEMKSVLNSLERDTRTLQFFEMGGGKDKGKEKAVAVKKIARSSPVSPKFGGLLYRLAKWKEPDIILEIGTSLGIGAQWLARGAPQAKVHTLEGNSSVLNIAEEKFQETGLSNIQTHSGEFSSSLPQVLDQLPKLDLVFMDGNHRKTPTLSYFRQCKALAHNDSLFILDDIHWSKEMEEAWEEVRNMEGVTLTMDLFRFGLVFFRKEQRQPLHLKLWY